MSDLNDVVKRYEDYREKEIQQAKSSFQAELPKLQEQGIAKIKVEYDGYGDSGTIEKITCFDNDDRELGDVTISPAVEELLSEFIPDGWDQNQGSFGTLTLDLSSRTLEAAHEWRIEDTEHEDFRFDL